MDGTDCSIAEKYPFNTKGYSHKLNGPGVRYEICVGIHSSNIVWLPGPFPFGSFPDLRIFRHGLKLLLQNSERLIGDDGYPDERCVHVGDLPPKERLIARGIRARHKVMNARLKKFNVLSSQFRHSLGLHSLCFFAVANLTFLVVEYEEPLFSVGAIRW